MRRLQHLLVISLIFLFFACNNSQEKTEYGKATKELIGLVENDPELKSMLISSIEKARQINPDRITNPVQNLEEYYEFISAAEMSMPWALVKREDYPKIFDSIIESISVFYFLIDQPLPELEGKGLVNNSLQYAEPFAGWLVSFSRSWGAFLDTEASWNDEYYQKALEDPNFGLQNGWYEDPSKLENIQRFLYALLEIPRNAANRFSRE